MAVRLRARYDARSGLAEPSPAGAQSQQVSRTCIEREHLSFAHIIITNSRREQFRRTCLRSLPDPAPGVCTTGLATQASVVTSNGIERKATAYLVLLTGGARLRLFLASLAKESPQQSIFQSVSRFPVSR
ncbi:hypothetical protein ALC57_16632 [Trachymyrmex cornetzi]|uniref:Uncharacterized protein n=1 Tax=Trachymyrmex cornetzi TaxID=471704 RepID=A0A151IUR8_9HYME|nr:hypothetical protein ALC57_16632 [Trachymyrmex cornetzi]